MSINKYNNGASCGTIRGIINSIVDAVNGFTSIISSIITRVEYVEKISVKTIVPLIGEQDGDNRNFTTEKDFIIGTSQLYLNGARFFVDTDYTEEENKVDFLKYSPKETDIVVFEAVEL